MEQELKNQIKDKIKQAIEAGLIAKTNEWKEIRTYITLNKMDWSYRGCKTYKIYTDHNTGELVTQSGKGTTPHDFDENLNQLIEFWNK